jgi:transcriptional regulator with XRE-family HTH domain
MQTRSKIGHIREDNGLMQKKVSAHLGIGNSNCNKLKNEHRNLSVDGLQRLAIFFHFTTDEILNYGKVIPTAVKAE